MQNISVDKGVSVGKTRDRQIRVSSQGGGSNMMPFKWFQTSKGLIYPGCTGKSERIIKHFS